MRHSPGMASVRFGNGNRAKSMFQMGDVRVPVVNSGGGMGYRWIASTLPIAAAAMVFAACGTTTESGNGSATASRPPVGAQMTPSDAVQSTVAPRYHCHA